MKIAIRFTAIAAIACSFALVGAQEKAPERIVRRNVITSEHDPSVRIELPKQVHYVGADRFVLLGVADCEIHVFVEADKKKNVKSLYWVQFEGFLPSQPNMQHSFKPTQNHELAGMDFDVRATVGPGNDQAKAGSDLEHVQKLVRAKGYTLPEGLINVRLVHLLDEKKQKELMVIYEEDVRSTGFRWDELIPGGRGYDQWPAIEKALIERTEAKIKFRR